MVSRLLQKPSYCFRHPWTGIVSSVQPIISDTAIASGTHELRLFRVSNQWFQTQLLVRCILLCWPTWKIKNAGIGMNSVIHLHLVQKKQARKTILYAKNIDKNSDFCFFFLEVAAFASFQMMSLLQAQAISGTVHECFVEAHLPWPCTSVGHGLMWTIVVVWVVCSAAIPRHPSFPGMEQTYQATMRLCFPWKDQNKLKCILSWRASNSGRLDMVVLLIELSLFIPLSVTVTIFQGHSTVKQVLTENFVFLSYNTVCLSSQVEFL